MKIFWTEDELLFVENLVGTIPTSELVEKVQAYQIEHTGHARSRDAILIKISDLGLSRKRELDCYTRKGLERILRTTRTRCNLIFAALRVAKVGGTYSINRSQLKRLIYKKPELFAGLDADILYFAIGQDNDLDTLKEYCQEVSRLKFRFFNTPISVRRLDTGEVFSSVNSASEKSFISNSLIAQAAAGKRKSACRVKWEYVENPQSPKS